MPPVTEIGFGDEDARRVNKNASGPVVPIFPAPSGEGVAEIVFAPAVTPAYVLTAGAQNFNCGGGITQDIFGLSSGFACSGTIPYAIGAISPPTFTGLLIHDLASASIFAPPGPAGNTTFLIIVGGSAGMFNSITIGSTTLLESAAAFFPGAAWTWPGIIIPAAGTYNVSFT